ncbi:hypothetical protein SAMN05421776_105374 [Nocardia farcinica]|uniref:Uncharacterized protein n=1 Tax=Nocardia farcinica TaxID=37329 RepID=A0A0H5NUC7_NOCFR|nr:hypothetical protein [Nocardia farcinica]AXK88844.1 hypothetical protein DXT66_27330 [Nocardia farcinica]MBA4858051.1 hypothetical protein [Nocardia farcinica]MBC9819418.1 hypothetical protein [Nocardia farcinica]PFX04035.1 hypothetical protein CJ469_01909 [Nocardia farcinica]PFX10193.1 hypothetical protein CJ468_01040 [Nocardia farcinica]
MSAGQLSLFTVPGEVTVDLAPDGERWMVQIPGWSVMFLGRRIWPTERAVRAEVGKLIAYREALRGEDRRR